MSLNDKKNKIDMLNGSLADKILRVALPLAAISILQQFFNAADVAVVGRFASKDAIAAVGANTSIINMFITLFTGLATGGNVAIATLIGKKRKDELSDAVQTVYTLSLISGLIIIILGEIFARSLLELIDTPANIIDSALLYLRIYIIAMAFGIVYNFLSAVLRSKGDTKRPMYCLIASGIINVLLNLLFVIVFKMDVAGVALATLIANIFVAAATILILMKEESPMKLELFKFMLVKKPLFYTLRIGLPAGIQGLLFSVSNVLIQSGINSFGSDCIAGNTAAMNFEFIAYFVINAFAQTTTTFVSQNYGAGKRDRCRKATGICLVMGVSMCLAVSLCFFLGADMWLKLFTTEAGVLAFAFVRMRCVVLMEPLTGLYEIPASALRGYGIAMPPTIITIIGSCVLRVIWMYSVFRIFNSYGALIIVYPVSWVLISIVMGLYYMKTQKRLG